MIHYGTVLYALSRKGWGWGGTGQKTHPGLGFSSGDHDCPDPTIIDQLKRSFGQ